MKVRIAVFAALLLTASATLSAVSHDNSKDYVASIDPPTGSMRCGFGVSGNLKSPISGYLTYGLFWRSELNIVSPMDRVHPTKLNHFAGPGTIRVTGNSKDVGDDEVFQKHKLIQVQLRAWNTLIIRGEIPPGGPQIPTLAESAWIDVPVGNSPCPANLIRLAPALAPSAPTKSATH